MKKTQRIREEHTYSIGLDRHELSKIGFADVPESIEEIRKIAALPNVEIRNVYPFFQGG